MIPTLPTVKIHANWIDIYFIGLRLRLDTFSNDLFVKQFPQNKSFRQLKYSSIKQSDFVKKSSKAENLNRPKARVKYFHFPEYVFGIDVAVKDHRLFFMAWLRSDFEKYRGGAFWKASFFCNPFLKQKEWFEFDLSTPKRVWPFGQIHAKEDKLKKGPLFNY